MAYCIDVNQPLSDELRRIVCEQIDLAAGQLAAVGTAPQDAVHQARKNFKKVRAVLRLVRDDLGECYARENAFYRDLAGSLRDLRDADVLLQRFDELVADRPRLAASQGICRIREGFIARRNEILTAHGDLRELAQSIASKLAGARERAIVWAAGPFGVDTVDRGFRRTYRRGKKAMGLILQNPTADRLHEWRKAVKVHWYHTRLLHLAWPKRMNMRRRSLQKLANGLGEGHDLSLVLQILADEGSSWAKPADMSRIAELAEQRRDTLRKPIMKHSERAYEIKSSVLSMRLRFFIHRRLLKDLLP